MEIKGIGNWASARPHVLAWSSEIGKRFGQLGLAKRIRTSSDGQGDQAKDLRLDLAEDAFERGREAALSGRGLARAAGGTLEQVQEGLGRLAELATRGATETLSEADRGALDTEFQGLADELADLVTEAEYGGVSLLSGASLTVQVGPDAGDTLTMDLPGPAARLGLGDLAGLDLADAQGALAALDELEAVTAKVGAAQGGLGAIEVILAGAADQALGALAALEARRGDGARDLARDAALDLRREAAVAVRAHRELDDGLVFRLLEP